MEERASTVAGGYLAVLLAAGAFYAVSGAPGALWQDSGLIQYRVWHNDIEGFLGLALSHPLYYILAIGAKYVPFGGFAHRVNLVSAMAGAVAVANLYLLVRLWLGKRFPAVVAAVTFAVSHTFWRHASIAETYTPWTMLFLGELVMLVQYHKTRKVGYLYALGLLNGLAIAVHVLSSIPLVCYAALFAVLLAKKTIRPKDVAVVALLWILGALPYEYLIARNMIGSGDVLGTLGSAAFGERWQQDVLNTSVSWRIVKENVLLMLLNFPTPNAVLFIVGCYALREVGPGSAFRTVTLVLLVLFFAFAFRYSISDRYAFFIPFYGMVSILVGLGAHVVQVRVRPRAVLYLIGAFSLLPVAVYAVTPALAEQTNLMIGTRGDVPYRNDYEYFLQPWKTGYRGAERFAQEALDTAEENGVIYADTTTVGPLLYMQEVKGRRPDVKIVTGIVSSPGAPAYGEHAMEQLIASHPVYVTSKSAGYCPAFIRQRYELVQAGVLWQVVRPTPETG
jgi:hypothetical protein